MGFPSVRATTYSEETADTTSHDVDMTGVQPGDRAMLFVVVDNDGSTVTLSGFPAGWSQVWSASYLSGGGQTAELWEKVDCSGSESSFAFVTSTSEQSKSRVFFVEQSDSVASSEAATEAYGATTTPDPSSLTPSWGADDTLWVAFFASDNSRAGATGYPSNYSSDQYTVSGASSVDSVTYGIATRQVNAASENPGTFTRIYPDRWIAVTFAVPPGDPSSTAILVAEESDSARFTASTVGSAFPAAPTGLQASSPNPRQVDLVWNPVTGATGYDIERTNQSSGITEIVAYNHPESSYTDTGLTPNTGYTYRVRAVIAAITLVGEAAETDISLDVVAIETPLLIVIAPENNVAQSVTALGGGVGAGVTGAPLSVPAGAITATPSNLATLIGSYPGGTAFALQSGTYVGSFPNKPGNQYYGIPSNHNAVIFDGQATYPDTNIGTKPNGGVATMMTAESGNIFANLTVQSYRTWNENNDGGPILFSGQQNVLFQNCEFRYQFKSGIKIIGANHRLRFCTMRHNGQYGWSGSGTDHIIENCLNEENGTTAAQSAGVPPHDTGDRGGCKMVYTTRCIIRNNEVRNFLGPAKEGIWYDIANVDGVIENNYIHQTGESGIFYELSQGGGIIRGNLLVECHQGSRSAGPQDGAAIFNLAGGDVLIEDNVVDGGTAGSWQGIQLTQYGSRDYSLGDAICGSVIRNNIVRGYIINAHVGVHSNATIEGCNPISTPSSVTIQNNDEQGTNVRYWFNTFKTAAEWAALGYS